MCDFTGGGEPLEKLKAMLPQVKITEEDRWEGVGDLVNRVNQALPALREAAGRCPACMLAALRQSGIPPYISSSFNFKEESKAVFAEANAEENALIQVNEF